MEELRIYGLDELDADELQEALPGGGVRIESSRTETPEGAHHEPMTILAVVIISSSAIRGLTAWLLKKRHRGTVEFETKLQRSDGTVERRRVRIELSESSSEADIIKLVGEKFGVDPGAVAEALRHVSG